MPFCCFIHYSLISDRYFWHHWIAHRDLYFDIKNSYSPKMPLTPLLLQALVLDRSVIWDFLWIIFALS